MRRAFRRAAGAAGAGTALAFVGSVYERPFPDVADGVWMAARGVTIRAPPVGPPPPGLDTHLRVVDEPSFFSAAGDGGALRPASRALAAAFSHVFVAGVAAASRALLGGLNTFDVRDDAHYAALVAAVDAARGGHDRGLLTLCNHASVFDDPPLVSALLPFRLAADARAARWAACAQEVCFSRGVLLSTLAGAGKALPIKRGGGVGQLGPQLAKLDGGRWVHLFPEGHVFQSGVIGRDDDVCSRVGSGAGRPPDVFADIGGLKWGAAVLAAHARRAPLVVPFHHRGMENVMPFADDGSRKTKPPLPRVGNAVAVRVGAAVDVDDLVTAYERAHGAIRGTPPPSAPTAAQRALYSAMTRRLEAALSALGER